jgi:outer membrane protein assembly factor BamA
VPLRCRTEIIGALLLCAVAVIEPSAVALTVDQLDAREWHLKSVDVHGNAAIPTRDVRAAILTKPRPWYLPWRKPTVFDPQTFETDLERLQRLYESRGYFETRIVYNLEAEKLGEGDLVSVDIWIEENQAVQVTSVKVKANSAREPPLPPELPIRSGEDFS